MPMGPQAEGKPCREIRDKSKVRQRAKPCLPCAAMLKRSVASVAGLWQRASPTKAISLGDGVCGPVAEGKPCQGNR